MPDYKRPSTGALFGAAILQALGKGVEGAEKGYESSKERQIKERDYALKRLTEERKSSDKAADRLLREKALAQQGSYQGGVLGLSAKRIEEQNADRYTLDTIGPKIEAAHAEAKANNLVTPNYEQLGLSQADVVKYNNAAKRSFVAKEKPPQDDPLAAALNLLGQ